MVPVAWLAEATRVSPAGPAAPTGPAAPDAAALRARTSPARMALPQAAASSSASCAPVPWVASTAPVQSVAVRARASPAVPAVPAVLSAAAARTACDGRPRGSRQDAAYPWVALSRSRSQWGAPRQRPALPRVRRTGRKPQRFAPRSPGGSLRARERRDHRRCVRTPRSPSPRHTRSNARGSRPPESWRDPPGRWCRTQDSRRSSLPSLAGHPISDPARARRSLRQNRGACPRQKEIPVASSHSSSSPWPAHSPEPHARTCVARWSRSRCSKS